MLNELAGKIHENAVHHGWWEKPREFTEIVALCHSELSEALEEYRDWRPLIYRNCRRCKSVADCPVCHPKYSNGNCPGWREDCPARGEKPEGAAVEMTDCLFRILDYLASEHVDIDAVVAEKMAYNAGRPNRHGGKRC